jgi:hypothetical protein
VEQNFRLTHKSTRMKIKIIASLMLFTGIVGFTGCGDIIDLDSIVISSPWGTGYSGSFPVYFPSEENNVQPGMLYADSVRNHGIDSLKLYGHFSSFNTIKRKVIIDEIVFGVYDEWGDLYEYDTVARNIEWNLHASDTTILFVAKVAAVTAYANNHFDLFMVVKNNLPGDHLQEKYMYRSNSRLLVDFPPLAFAIYDSITFMGSSKAILWVHLETKSDCEIIHSVFEWHEATKTPRYDTISAPQYLTSEKNVYLRDTIDVVPNSQYSFRFYSLLKFNKDSLVYIKTNKINFLAL